MVLLGRQHACPTGEGPAYRIEVLAAFNQFMGAEGRDYRGKYDAREQ
ncbi:MAG: hypothetical protein KGL70_12600 [Betaproteobacteria bacterium]|nr:hypothetical protein [Betaproteobacteria bacterium]